MLDSLSARLIVRVPDDAAEVEAQRERRKVLHDLIPTAPPAWRRFLEQQGHRVQRGGLPTLLALAEAEPPSSALAAAARAHVAAHPVARPALVAATGPAREACLRTLEPLPKVVLEGAALTPGATVAWAAGSGTIHRCDLVRGEVQSGDDSHGANPRWIAAALDGPVVTVGDDGAVHLWDRTTLAPRKAATVRGDVTGLALSPDGAQLAIATDRGLLLGEPTGRKLRTLVAEACAGAPAFDARGAQLAVVALDGTIRLVTLAGGARVVTLEPTAAVEAVAFHPDGRLLASTSEGLEIWAGGRAVTSWTFPRAGARAVGGVEHVALTADGGTAITGGASDDLVVWDLVRGGARGALVTGSLGALALATLADGRAVTVEHDGVRSWDLAAIAAAPAPRPAIEGVAFVDDHRLLVFDQAGVTVRSAPALAVLAHVATPPPRAGRDRVAIALSPDRRHVASWAGDELFVREVATLAETWRFATRADDEPYDEDTWQDRSITAVRFAGDLLVISTAHERTPRVVRVDGTPAKAPRPPARGDAGDVEPTQRRRLPDGRALTWDDDTLILHDAAGDRERARWVAAGPIHDVAIAPVGELVAIATTLGGLELIRWHDGPPALTVTVPAEPDHDDTGDDVDDGDDVDELFAAEQAGLPAGGAERVRALLARADGALPLQEEEYLAQAERLVDELRAALPADRHAELNRELGLALLRTDDGAMARRGVVRLRAAIDAGSVEALFDLGLELFHGDHVKAKPKEGLRLLERAAEREHPRALHWVGMEYFEDPRTRDRALALVTRAAELDVPWARTQLADWALDGTFGTKDPARALSLYTEVADQDAGAAAGLAILHRHGLGVPKDAALAKHWYQRAKEAGHDWSDDDRW